MLYRLCAYFTNLYFILNLYSYFVHICDKKNIIYSFKMTTSLAEQLKKLRTPQTGILLQDKKRASLLFDPREAANLDRETVLSIGKYKILYFIYKMYFYQKIN